MKLLKRVQYNSPVILSFSLLSLIALILGALTGGGSTRLLFSVYRAPLSEILTWFRFFTHCLGHVGYEHFIANILLILVVGPPMEERYGSLTLLCGMALTAFVSGWAAWLFFPGGTAVLGASGLVYMLIILSSFGGQKEGKIPLTLVLVALLYVGGEIVTGILRDDNISQLAHVIGGVCGGFLGFAIRGGLPRKSPIETISSQSIREQAASTYKSSAPAAAPYTPLTPPTPPSSGETNEGQS